MTAKKKQTGIKGALTAAGVGVAVTVVATLIAAAVGAKLLASPSSALYMAAGCLGVGALVAAFMGGKNGGFVYGVVAGGAVAALFFLLSLCFGGVELVMPIASVTGMLIGVALSLNKPSKAKKRAAKLRRR